MEGGFYSDWLHAPMEASMCQQHAQGVNPPPAGPPRSSAAHMDCSPMPPPAADEGPEFVRILYVNSSTVNVWDTARTLENAVREYGCNRLIAAVDVVRDGMEALNSAVRCDYNVIIIAWDLKAPLTAQELVGRLRQTKVHAHLVLLAGGPNRPTQEVACDLGFHALLYPPLSKKSFCAGIAALVLAPTPLEPIAAATAPPELPPMPPATYWEGSLPSFGPTFPSRRAEVSMAHMEAVHSTRTFSPTAAALEGWEASQAFQSMNLGAQARTLKRSRPPDMEEDGRKMSIAP